jgi:hypothetical protein
VSPKALAVEVGRKLIKTDIQQQGRAGQGRAETGLKIPVGMLRPLSHTRHFNLSGEKLRRMPVMEKRLKSVFLYVQN